MLYEFFCHCFFSLFSPAFFSYFSSLFHHFAGVFCTQLPLSEVEVLHFFFSLLFKVLCIFTLLYAAIQESKASICTVASEICKNYKRFSVFLLMTDLHVRASFLWIGTD